MSACGLLMRDEDRHDSNEPPPEAVGLEGQDRTLPPVVRAKGVTPTERYLARLCSRSFLRLWSYPCVYRDQMVGPRGGQGKEVCDLLVVFDEDVIVFSDKDCEYKATIGADLAWSRWVKRAVFKSADQVFGAERWLKENPNRLFLDKECKSMRPAKHTVDVGWREGVVYCFLRAARAAGVSWARLWMERLASLGRISARYSRMGRPSLRQLSTMEKMAATLGPAS